MDEKEQLQALIDGADEILGITPDAKTEATDSKQESSKEVEGDTEADADEKEGEESEENKEEEGEYVPSYTYKVKDSELEFDDRVKSIIKTKDDEAFVRDLYTKAGGLDAYKEKYAKVEGMVAELDKELNETATAKEQLQSFIEGLVELRDGGNIRKLLETIGVDEEALLQEALGVAKERELPANEKAALAAKRKYERELEELENSKRQAKQSEVTASERANQELINRQVQEFEELANGVHKDFASKLESNGIDLFEEVTLAGRKMFATTNKVPTMADAIGAVQNKFKFLMATNTEQKKEVKKVVQKKEAIPPVKSGGSSPVATQVSSLEDLQKAFNSLR